MKNSTLSLIAAAWLAGCSAPAGTTVAIPAQPMGVKSNTSSALIYVADNIAGTIKIYTTTGTVSGSISGLTSPTGLCSDSTGNVWVVAQGSGGHGQLLEFSHGGTTPIASLAIPGKWGYGCAIDPTNGNLAVTSSGNEVSIFANAQGTPTTYTDTSAAWFHYCGYDGSGNLFLVGEDGQGATLHEFSGGVFSRISLAAPILDSGAVQWDGTYLDVEQGPYHNKKPITIDQLAVSGNYASVSGSVTLSSQKDSPTIYPQFWIYNGSIIMATNHRKQLATWAYPQGGSPTMTIKHTAGLWGTTVSVGG